ncbi:hypothetical protein OK074_3475 [Actinobacteria bacterium OK074]|nr:hypothetical protein OK074_3475 [Actinobacteria bacterium OK074]
MGPFLHVGNAMRIRATVAAVSGALALSAFAVPVAQAADSGAAADIAKVQEAVKAAAGKSPMSSSVAADDTDLPYTLDASFSKVTVNKGKTIAVGTRAKVTVPVTFTLTHAEDVDITAADFYTGVDLYRGTSYDEADWWLSPQDTAKCTATSTTVATCTESVVISPADDLYNEDAGKWKAAGFAIALNGVDLSDENADITKVGYVEADGFTAPNIVRVAQLTVNAAPEPVKKGKTITVTGKLKRANWDTGTFAGYKGASVKLQFKKKGSSTYTTLKTITSGTYGALKTTTKATADGTYRFSYAGSTYTQAINSSGDAVDVK